MYKKKFKEDMFESELIVVVSSREEIIKMGYDCTEDCKWFYAEDWILWIEESSISLKYLSHEIIHFVSQQLRTIIDIKLNAETEENYAYFYSYYLDKIWKRMSALQIKNEKK